MVRGFSYGIGNCSVVEAELWTIARGMEFALHMNCTRVVVETDSKFAVEWLNGTEE